MQLARTTTLTTLRIFGQRLALFAVVLTALAAVVTCVLAAVGVWPWLGLTATVGDTVVAQAGMYLQIGFAVLMTLLCFFLPSAVRMLTLETSHRNFRMSMDDVANAYWAAHSADRSGAFVLNREFDTMRDRIEYLRDHPDLGSLEPALLEIASQMSFESRDLAEVYSDEKVSRARAFLLQRKQELEEYQDRIHRAHTSTAEIRDWMKQVELDENVVDAQIERLEKDLAEVLPAIGLRIERDTDDLRGASKDSDKVVAIGAKEASQSKAAQSKAAQSKADKDAASTAAE